MFAGVLTLSISFNVETYSTPTDVRLWPSFHVRDNSLPMRSMCASWKNYNNIDDYSISNNSCNNMSRDSSVGIVTWWMTGAHFPVRAVIFLFTVSRQALGPTKHPIQWLKRPEREGDHSPPSISDVKNSGAIPPLPDTSSRLVRN
jgi:hypothetical protein